MRRRGWGFVVTLLSRLRGVLLVVDLKGGWWLLWGEKRRLEEWWERAVVVVELREAERLMDWGSGLPCLFEVWLKMNGLGKLQSGCCLLFLQRRRSRGWLGWVTNGSC